MTLNNAIISRSLLLVLIMLSCTSKEKDQKFLSELNAINLTRGEIALCGSGEKEFGTVAFSQSCSEETRADFNLAAALLHSFEYTDAEKVFAKVIDQDPACVMAYWGVAMCNFHPLWAPPSKEELAKGLRTVNLARSLEGKSPRESDFLEAIATIYDHSDSLDHRTRLLNFEKASENVFQKYPDDTEAAVFYALALRAAADPKDKTFVKQKRAGEILNALYGKMPDHPGIAHYIIHNYDYPELATIALPAARKYASIAAASAHAQHMPSHIFTRLGLWDESIQSNIASISAAQCYAQNMQMHGHWDEELHGMDYLIYAYLQKGNDAKALQQIEYLKSITEVYPQNFKNAYAFATMPARYAVERKKWEAAAQLELKPAGFPWEKYPWEKANLFFARILGAVHINNLKQAKADLIILDSLHQNLISEKQNRKADFVLVQIKAGQALIKFKEGNKTEAVALMTAAAEIEDATEKEAVTPGEVTPARELLGDLYMEMKDYNNALVAYKADLERHANRYNGLAGAALAAEKAGDKDGAKKYKDQLQQITVGSTREKPNSNL